MVTFTSNYNRLDFLAQSRARDILQSLGYYLSFIYILSFSNYTVHFCIYSYIFTYLLSIYLFFFLVLILVIFVLYLVLPWKLMFFFNKLHIKSLLKYPKKVLKTSLLTCTDLISVIRYMLKMWNAHSIQLSTVFYDKKHAHLEKYRWLLNHLNLAGEWKSLVWVQCSAGRSVFFFMGGGARGSVLSCHWVEIWMSSLDCLHCSPTIFIYYFLTVHIIILTWYQ